jgi:hypothetical protein
LLFSSPQFQTRICITFVFMRIAKCLFRCCFSFAALESREMWPNPFHEQMQVD